MYIYITVSVIDLYLYYTVRYFILEADNLELPKKYCSAL